MTCHSFTDVSLRTKMPEILVLHESQANVACVKFKQSWSTAYARHVERPLITDKQTIPMDW